MAADRPAIRPRHGRGELRPAPQFEDSNTVAVKLCAQAELVLAPRADELRDHLRELVRPATRRMSRR